MYTLIGICAIPFGIEFLEYADAAVGLEPVHIRLAANGPAYLLDSVGRLGQLQPVAVPVGVLICDEIRLRLPVHPKILKGYLLVPGYIRRRAHEFHGKLAPADVGTKVLYILHGPWIKALYAEVPLIAVQALAQGKIDAVVIDGEPAKQYIKEVEGLKIIDESYTDEDYAIAIKKGNTAMVEAVNAALAELKSEGKLDEIVAKYIQAEQ